MDEALWTVEELRSATGGKVVGEVRAPLNGVSIDSRSISAGDIFVAIKGDRMDGHEFVANALKAGAGLAVVSHPTDAMAACGALLVVDSDPLQALEQMGVAARARSHGKIIAITGSVGKTSTKEMLRTALSASGETHASAASFNNHWGVPLTLSRFSKRSAYGVFEIGMNHSGEITPLVKMVKPHIAIITNVAASHLGNFATLDDIAVAKAEIFSGVVEGGCAVINRDSDYFDQLRDAAMASGIKQIVGFGQHAQSDVRAEKIVLHPACCCITADVMGEKLVYRLGLPGHHMALNSLAALAAIKLSGADLARGALALADAKPAKGRGVQQSLRAESGEILLLDESYNANPTSMAAALALLGQMKPGRDGRRIAILGDMLELGQHAVALHRDIAGSIEVNGVDLVFASGPHMAHLWDALPAAHRGGYAENSEELSPIVISGLRAGDCVMVKGSLGSRMALVTEAMKARWPAADRES